MTKVNVYKQAMLTVDRLYEVLTYDPDTGIFTRNFSRGGMRAGTVAGSRKSDGYIHINLDGQSYLASRLAYLYMMGEWPPDEIGHSDLDPSDNRWDKLRPATHAQTMSTRRGQRNSLSGIKNINFVYNGWKVTIKTAGRSTVSRYFRQLPDAIKYRDKMLQELHGEFARFEESDDWEDPLGIRAYFDRK